MPLYSHTYFDDVAIYRHKDFQIRDASEESVECIASRWTLPLLSEPLCILGAISITNLCRRRVQLRSIRTSALKASPLSGEDGGPLATRAREKIEQQLLKTLHVLRLDASGREDGYQLSRPPSLTGLERCQIQDLDRLDENERASMFVAGHGNNVSIAITIFFSTLSVIVSQILLRISIGILSVFLVPIIVFFGFHVLQIVVS